MYKASKPKTSLQRLLSSHNLKPQNLKIYHNRLQGSQSSKLCSENSIVSEILLISMSQYMQCFPSENLRNLSENLSVEIQLLQVHSHTTYFSTKYSRMLSENLKVKFTCYTCISIPLIFLTVDGGCTLQYTARHKNGVQKFGLQIREGIANIKMVFWTALCLHLVIIHAVVAEWTAPVEFGRNSHQSSMVLDMYTDPSTEISHVLYMYWSGASAYCYSAIYPNGSLIHSTKFSIHHYYWSHGSKIKGAGDGRHLYIALGGTRRIHTGGLFHDVSFTESSDGGKSWSPMVQVPKENSSDTNNRVMNDMVYIKETGRIFIFYFSSPDKVYVVTRSPGSSIFSLERLIAQTATCHDSNGCIAATYSYWLSKLLIHVVFADGKHLLYMRSSNNGISWSSPRVIAKDFVYAIHGVEADKVLPSAIALIYERYEEPAPYALIVSKNYGDNFSEPMNIGKYKSPHTHFTSTGGLKICGARGFPTLATFTINDHSTSRSNSSYFFWDFDTFIPFPQDNIFETFPITSAKITCTTDNEHGTLNVNAVVGMQTEKCIRFLFTRDIVPIPEKVRAQSLTYFILLAIECICMSIQVNVV
eukprot:TRINITY_DN100_c0_g1_i1.p1 TRINITY_DN100_c0_g1~~TRINITY_DN100_c0_g1_i1.p1  ORF type:complete len:587 (-),score=-38.40 TRINITY_DN100_c0_g1_i1:118-1878(-)